MRKILNLKTSLIFSLLISFGGAFAQSNATRSVLADGTWFKLRLATTGIYKVSYEYLSSIGYDVSGLKSDEIKLHGNSTGMLPFLNSMYRPDDLVQNALIMMDGGDGNFGPGDYFLFYAVGPDTWKYDTAKIKFVHTKHCYDDYSYLFLGRNSLEAKRATVASEITGNPEAVVSQFPDFQFYEKDIENLAKSGRTIYGEKFDFVENYSFDFNFSDLVPAKPAKLTVDAAMKSKDVASSIRVSSGGTTLGSMNYAMVDDDYTQAVPNETLFQINNPNSQIRVDLAIVKGSQSATAWLNYIEVVVDRNLNFSGSSLRFRTLEKRLENKLISFQIAGAPQGMLVYDITNPTRPVQIQGTNTAGTFEFKAYTDTLREYVAINGSNFASPETMGKVGNQNLHGMDEVDMVIVSHPEFLDQAERLAAFHRAEGLSIAVLTPDIIYNEFSSGARDVTAIKDLMKMLYKRAQGNPTVQPKYLLLFGDGSYMNKDYPGNTNFLPTWQSENSTDLVGSYVSDDYFGFLDDNEGEDEKDKVDIGIGRFPVSSKDQARQMVDKIMHYVSKGYTANEESPYGGWRNKVLFVADDLSGNPGSNGESYHMTDTEKLSKKVDTFYKPYLTDKIYMDAYKQISTPGGQRYPEAAEAFRNKVQQGALIVNYTGHGGEVGLAHERVLDIQTIEGWTNYDALPLFVTATCEFSRFDDPARTSAGELVFLNSKGGGIALLTTTRLVYSEPNKILNLFFYDYALPDSTGKTRTLGEITMYTKQKAAGASGGQNHMNFMLIGDPALRLAYPKYRVKTTTINDVPVAQQTDTIRAFNKVKISGRVDDLSGNLLSGFNGVVDVTVMDKPESLTTLGNDAPVYVKFDLKDKIIYKGKATVSNGTFQLEFIVPRDISFAYGKGSILYYASNGTDDANGGFEDITVGGVSADPVNDNQGPSISLFLNTTDFNVGDITDENPKLLAFVSDDSGINTTGNGIGHDILATLDANTENAIVLNNYYTADLDTYKKGTISYPYNKLSEGPHTLTVKVWDINNNSASATTNFVVATASSLTVENLMNYPNPVVTETTFGFDHNQAGKDLTVKVEIFNSMGQVVKLIEKKINDSGYQSNTVSWDCTSDGGYTIDRGMYVYRLTVSKEDGTQVSKTNRLLLLK